MYSKCLFAYLNRVIRYPMIYEFDDPIHFLKSVIKQKTDSNPQYSLRSFAKKLGISPGALSLFLNRKKRISVERAHSIAQALSLDSKSTDYFMTLVQLEGAKSESLKNQCIHKIKSLNPHLKSSRQFKQKIVNLEQFKLISDWFGLAILELFSMPHQNWKVKDISQKMGLSKLDVELTLDRLVKLDLIQKTTEATYIRRPDTLLVQSSTHNEAIKKYYQGVHRQSFKSIREQSPQEKVIGAQVFAFDPSQLDEVRALTDEYLNRLNTLANSGTHRTEIYQAITNVFKLSKSYKENQ